MPDTDSARGLILTNIESVPGRAIVEHYGLVSGSTVRSKHVGRDLMASFRNVFGGELTAYTELLEEARSDRRLPCRRPPVGPR